MVMFVSFLVYCVERRPGDVTLDNLFNGFYWGVVSKYLKNFLEFCRLAMLFT